jgi:diguanylate cyclase (GGDEF)-like protein
MLAYFLLGSPTAHATYRIGLDLLPVAATTWALWRRRPKPAYPWVTLLAAEITYVVADALWAHEVAIGEGHARYPSVADGTYLASYVVLAVGIWFLIKTKIGTKDKSALLDASILVTGVGLLYWVVGVHPATEAALMTWTGRAVTMAYPLLDLVLLVFACHLFLRGDARTRPLLLLALAALSAFLADSAYATLSLAGHYKIGNVLDLGWMVMAVFLGAAALHPDMSLAGAQEPQELRPATSRRILLLASAVLSIPIAFAIEFARQGHVHFWEFMCAGSLLLVLFVTRVALLMKELGAKITELRRQRGVLHSSLAERDALSRELGHQALHDALTGLPNRALFFDRVSVAIEGTRRHPGRVALLFIDVDEFKLVNDRFGHGVGDDLLVKLAVRLKQALRGQDSAARLGGDEFGVLLMDVADEGEAVAIANRLVATLGAPATIRGIELDVTTSIGVGFCFACSQSVEELVRRADVAMYSAKRTGKDQAVAWRSEMTGEMFDRLVLKEEILHGLEQGEFWLAYQPIVELESGRIAGVEALVRWTHPERGFVGPDDFIPAAEETGVIAALDRHVMREACRQLSVRAGIRRVRPDDAVGERVAPVEPGDRDYGTDGGDGRCGRRGDARGAQVLLRTGRDGRLRDGLLRPRVLEALSPGHPQDRQGLRGRRRRHRPGCGVGPYDRGARGRARAVCGGGGRGGRGPGSGPYRDGMRQGPGLPLRPADGCEGRRVAVDDVACRRWPPCRRAGHSKTHSAE